MDTMEELEARARYVLLAPLAEGRRVLDLGGPSAAGLLALRAAAGCTTWVVARDAGATARRLGPADAAIQGVRHWVGGRLPFEDDSFDLVVGHLPAPETAELGSLLAEIRRLLVADGALALALPNPGGRGLAQLLGRGNAAATSAPSLETVQRACAAHFAAQAVIGQAPLCGSLFFDCAPDAGDDDLSLDRSLLADEDEAPGTLLLLCGARPLRRDDLAIVQLPPPPPDEARPAARPAPTTRAAPPPAELEAQLAHALQVIAQLERELRAATAGAAHHADLQAADNGHKEQPHALQLPAGPDSSGPGPTPPTPSQVPSSPGGSELDTAAQELEDLLKDVALTR